MTKIPDIARDELIGKGIEVISAKNQANLGIAGSVADETKHLIVIETKQGLKRLNKRGNVFRISCFGKNIIVDGERLIGAPEERIRTKV